MEEIVFLLSKEWRTLRVAAYCRVSTKYPDQFGGLEHQHSHFERVVKDTPDRQLVKIYLDTGSGLKKDNRPGYQAMIAANVCPDSVRQVFVCCFEQFRLYYYLLMDRSNCKNSVFL